MTDTETVPFSLGQETETSGFYIPDDDGSPRWEWPASSRTPLFLELFQAITFRQKIFSAAVRIVFFLRLQRIVFPATTISGIRNMPYENWATFNGTPGPNRKRVVVSNEQTICKLAMEGNSQLNLENERFMLQQLEARADNFSFLFPRVIRSPDYGLTMTKLANNGTWKELTGQHISALEELRLSDQTIAPIGRWTHWGKITTRLAALRNDIHRRIPRSLVNSLQRLVDQIDRTPEIEFGLAHGDFTPWNTLKSTADKLAIIDWEMARPDTPAGYDFFHFHLQKGIMVDRKSWQEIYAEIRDNLKPEVRIALFGNHALPTDDYLRLYLADHISYYLNLYQEQAVWHTQIYWQLDVWAEALAALSPAKNQRKMLISRFFEVLHQQSYAVLKMEQDNPLELMEYSDLDVLVQAEDARSIIRRVVTFPLIASYKLVKKSYMASLLIQLKDGQVLSLDFIWQLKRRATVFMDIRDIIRSTTSNSYGIRIAAPSQTANYLRLFYGLNGGTIPIKHGISGVLKQAPALAENRGLGRIRNIFNYILDTLKGMMTNRGFIITFSGVDGAGKSTVIEEVVRLVDKKYRRPVKVLRHRPSVLPILSSYLYGKAAAEQRSVAKLPRSGNNSSSISSLARFSYYYLDYQLGQWYVFFRYLLRGQVVVYDRYYYDFIVDAKRSNIQLPRWLSAAGFRLILKPAINIFLYAAPEVILGRKKELTATTITKLTQGYRSLFDQYQKRYLTETFTAIENVDLTDTIEQIDQLIGKKIFP